MYARFLSPRMYDSGLLSGSAPCELCLVRLAKGAPTWVELEEEALWSSSGAEVAQRFLQGERQRTPNKYTVSRA